MKYISYFIWLTKQIVQSSIAVTKIIWSHNIAITPSIDWVVTKHKNQVSKVIYANSISLTPGTITIDLEGNKLLIHSLTKENLLDLQAGVMDGKIPC